MKTNKFLIGLSIEAAILVALVVISAFTSGTDAKRYRSQNFAPSTDEIIRRKEQSIALTQSRIDVKITEMETGRKSK